MLQPGDVYVYLDGGEVGVTMGTSNRLFAKSKGRYPVVCQAEGLTKKVVNVIFDEDDVKPDAAVRTKSLRASTISMGSTCS